MDSTQVNMISEVRLGFLSAEQRAAVEHVKNDDPVDPDQWPQEGCEGECCTEGKLFEAIIENAMEIGEFKIKCRKIFDEEMSFVSKSWSMCISFVKTGIICGKFEKKLFLEVLDKHAPLQH